MLRPKIFPMLWKTWVAYGLPHGFVRHDKILPIQPPNLKKKTPFQQDRFVFKMPTLPQSAPSEWPQVAAPDTSQRVAASGRPRHFPASGRKWPLQPVPSDWPQVAAFCDFNFHPQSNIPGKLSAELAASYHCGFSIFYLKYCAWHENVQPGHTKCCTCHAKSSQQMWRSDSPKCTSLRKSAPWPPNMSDCCVFCTAPATRHASLQILFKRPTPAIVFENATKPQRLSHFWLGAESMAPATQKDAWQVQKWSKHVVLLAFWLPNVLRATTACTFGQLNIIQHPTVLRHWGVSQGVLNVLTPECASRRNSVQLLISHLPMWLRTRRFSEPTCRPSEVTRHTVRDFSTFSCTWT